MITAWLDADPLVVAIAGPNGAGKTTFYHSHVEPTGLRHLNADRLAKEMQIDPYVAAEMANQFRQHLVSERQSFAFETDFSDPVGDKLQFLEACRTSGYTTALLYIGLASAKLSAERVTMRVSQGGHDVPSDKLKNRFPRTLANLREAIKRLPSVVVYDNSDLAHPYRQLAIFEKSEVRELAKPVPKWFRAMLSENG